MSMWLRQSTASQEILLGPFVDDTDGKTAETALSIANTDIKLWKEGGTTEASKNSGGATHIASGRYYAVLDATDTDTLGKLEVSVHVAGALPVRREFMVVPAMIYDSVILGTDRLDANVTHIGDTAQTARDIGASVLLSSGTGTGQVTLTSGRVNADITHIAASAVSTSTAQLGVNVVNLAGSAVSASAGLINANVTQLSGDSVAADNAEAFFDGTGYAGTNNVIPLVTTTTNVTTVNGLAAGVITAASIAADAITDAKVAADVTIASVTGSVGSVTGNVGGNVAGSVGSVTARVTANTDQLAGQTVTAAAGVTFPTSVASPTNITAGTITTATNVTTVNGLAAGVITAAAIATDAIDADALASDAVAEIQSGLSTLNAAGVRAAVGLASANLDTQLGDLPTNAELATALDGADDAVLAAIEALSTSGAVSGSSVETTSTGNYAQDLVLARNRIAAIILAVVTNPKPTYSLEGQSVSWESYLSMLLDKQETINKAIQQAGSPFQKTKRGRF